MRPRCRWRAWLLGLGGLVLGLGLVTGTLTALMLTVEPVGATATYVEAHADEPPLLNPILAPYTLAGQDVLPLVFSGLVRADSAGNSYPDLAERWDVTPDGRVYVFQLRDGLTWHDGVSLDAHDVAFTVGLVQAPDHQGSAELAELWRGIAVDVADARTVRFSLPEPLASFPEHLTLGLLPRHLLEGVPAGELPHHPFNRQPVGSGPYRVTAIDSARIVLDRASGGQSPAMAASRPVERIELRFFADRPAAVQALLDGQVDGLGQVQANEVDRLASAAGLVMYSFPERSKVASLSLNVQTPLFRERAVRLAVGRAVDRVSLIRRALGGQAEPSFGPIPLQSWAYARASGSGEYDPAAATALLDSAGWTVGPNGRRAREGEPLAFSMLTADTPDRVAVAQELADQLRQVGFEVRVQPLPADELTEEHLEPRRFEAALVGQWGMGSDPDVYPRWHSSQATRLGDNYAGFSDPDVDRWLEVGRQRHQPEDRRNAYLHFQARWAEEQPSVVLYHPLYTFAVSKDVRGIAADPAPDSTWRLREAVQWSRSGRPSLLQQARAAVADGLGWLKAT